MKITELNSPRSIVGKKDDPKRSSTGTANKSTGITGRMNRLINSAIVPKKAEKYPLSMTESPVDVTNEARNSGIRITDAAIPSAPRIARVINTVSKFKLIFYAMIPHPSFFRLIYEIY